MKSIWKFIVAKQGLFYRFLLILFSSILILYLFPLGGQFKYEFQKGRAWQYPDFYSPFDFSILKTEIELNWNKLIYSIYKDNVVIKKTKNREKIKKDGYNPTVAFDDRDQVVNMWRKLGIICYQVREGKF